MNTAYFIHELVHVAAPVFTGFIAGFIGSYLILDAKYSAWLKAFLILVLVASILWVSEALHRFPVDVAQLWRPRQLLSLCGNNQATPTTYAR